MPIPPELDRSDLLRLTPSEYLEQGYRDHLGGLRPELQGTFATAAAVQLEEAETSPQELGATLEALRQVLPWHDGPAPERLQDAVTEALGLVSSLYQQENNKGIVEWLGQCVERVKTPADIDAFLDHFTAVVRQYAVIIAVRTA